MGDLGHEHSHALGNPLLRVPVGTHARDQGWKRSGHLTQLQAALDDFLCQFLVHRLQQLPSMESPNVLQMMPYMVSPHMLRKLRIRVLLAVCVE